MALIINPRITTNGLVLAFDADDAKSYPGTGTVFYDRSGYTNNALLTGGPTGTAGNPVFYNGSVAGINGNYVRFDGITQYMDFYAPNISTIATVDMWCRPDFVGSNSFLFSWFIYGLFMDPSRFGYNTGNGDVYGIPNSNLSSKWNHYVFEMRSDVSYTNNKMYINGVNQSLSQLVGTENVGNRTFNNGNGRVANWGAANLPLTTLLGSFRIYNRALTQAEISQNFNCVRGKYNV